MTLDKALSALGLALFILGIAWGAIGAVHSRNRLRNLIKEVQERRQAGLDIDDPRYREVIGTWGDALVSRGNLRLAVEQVAIDAVFSIPAGLIIVGSVIQGIAALL